MRATFELFDHTADIGIRARAGTLAELLVVSGQALYAVIGELAAGGESQWAKIELTASDAAVLLRDYLDELLVIFDRDHRFATSAQVSLFDEHQIAVGIETQRVDDQRSVYHHEVKAVTYHALAIRKIEGGYEATVILDI